MKEVVLLDLVPAAQHHCAESPGQRSFADFFGAVEENGLRHAPLAGERVEGCGGVGVAEEIREHGGGIFQDTVDVEMGYRELYPEGTAVQIANREALAEFRRTWRFHHPLTDEQMDRAGVVSLVKSVGFYHGGDVLYELDGILGIWHEACLAAAPVDEDKVSPSALFSSEDIHHAAFPEGRPKSRTVEEMKEGIRQYVRKRYARR